MLKIFENLWNHVFDNLETSECYKCWHTYGLIVNVTLDTIITFLLAAFFPFKGCQVDGQKIQSTVCLFQTLFSKTIIYFEKLKWINKSIFTSQNVLGIHIERPTMWLLKMEMAISLILQYGKLEKLVTYNV